jgi:hypothetical protein
LNWKITFIKKKKNQQNKGQTEKNKTMKNLILWWNWKKKNTSTKVPRTKLEILKNKDQNKKPNIWEIAIEGLDWKEYKLL